ncbi:hypothetical protein [Weissella confusa]|uniref:hypothetical protein n=1 Tax=Weissella confusa TaxID=1583 RepID=UPI00223B0327|nr:hypothetical protein [Weissella confusa]
MMKFKYTTFFISLLSISLIANVVSASYILNTFKVDQTTITKINNLSSAVKQTTDKLLITSDNIIALKNSSSFDTQFKKSFQNKTTVNSITTPPYQSVGQIYWSTVYNSLVSTNGSTSYIWIGSTWVPFTTTGFVTGTQMTVANALNQNLGVLPNKSISIDNSGNLYNVQVSRLRGQLINITSAIYLSTMNTQISSIHWDSTANKLVGTVQSSGFFSSSFDVAYSTTPDSVGSYWSDATLK